MPPVSPLRGPKSRAALILFAGAAVIAITSAASSPPSSGQCSVTALQAAAPADTTITSAELLQAPVPHCKVEGYVTTNDPGPNKNDFRLQLPAREKWNGRFFFIGLGGTGGYVPTDAQFPSGNPIMAGFAAAGTNKGHDKTDPNWEHNKAQLLDNAHRGGHVVTVAAQQLTKAYYGVQKMYRYHGGCSGGGQMGIQAMQLHPEDYDGVLLGWPGGRQPDPKKRGVIDHAIYVREMTREPGAWLSPAKRKFAQEKVNAACDALDGAKDDMIWDSRLCKFDFKALLCKGGDGPNCLTKPEVTSIENILRDTSAPISTIADWSYLGNLPPPWPFIPHDSGAGDIRTILAKSSLAYVISNEWAQTILNQPTRDIQKQPLTREEMWKILSVRAEQAGTIPYGRVGLDDFARAGGKAIFFVGEGDTGSSSQANEQYFRDLWAKSGRENVDKMARLYVVPGWGHCAGTAGPPDGTDRMMQALMDWVEKGKAPQEIVAHRGESRDQFLFASVEERKGPRKWGHTLGMEPARDFKLCPFPLVPLFDKSKAGVAGAVYEASNWSCVAPEQRAASLKKN